MESWRVDAEEPERPEVMSMRTLLMALGLHVFAFVFFYVTSWLYPHKDEKVIPIDLTVIVNENLDGNEEEPPPLQNPTPEPPPPPPPKPEPKEEKVKEPEKPKELEQIITNIVAKVDKKEEKKKEKEKPKKEKPKEPEKPKKTKAQLRKERLEAMRKSAKVSNKPVKIEVKNAPSGNGRTAKQTMSEAEIRKLLNQGYRPGRENQIAQSELQRCTSLVQMALNEKWNQLMPKIGREGTVFLSVQFNSNGGMVNVRISQSCGDRLSDEAALSVARRVNAIPGLSPQFIGEFRQSPLTIRYKVEGR